MLDKSFIYKDLNKIPNKFQDCVAILGNFDGVHRGHQMLLNQAKNIANDNKKPLVVFTFIRHPRLYFDSTKSPFLITSLETKSLYLKALGVKAIIAIDFNDIKNLSANEFIDDVLINKLDVNTVIVGYDFKFGKNRTGDTDLLKQQTNFKTFIAEAKSDSEGVIFSSTNIRKFIKNGAMQKATAQLGRPFEINSIVIKGQQLGGKIGFPTANIEFEQDIVRPKYGVYAVNLYIIEQDKWFSGIANFGIRPTIKDNKEVLEVHLFDFNQNIYGKQVRVAFIEYIRAEQKFENLDELKKHIAKDCYFAKQIHKLRFAGG